MDENLRSEVQPSDMQQRQERLHTERRESQRHSQDVRRRGAIQKWEICCLGRLSVSCCGQTFATFQ